MIDCDPKELELNSKLTPAIKPLPPTLVGSTNTVVTEDPKPKVEIASASHESTRPVVDSKKSATTVTKIPEKKKKEED